MAKNIFVGTQACKKIYVGTQEVKKIILLLAGKEVRVWLKIYL